MKKIVVAMSGGVDSSVCAAVLQEKGYDVSGAIMRLRRDAEQDISDCQRVCEHLGIPLEIYDFTDVFEREVISPFCREYLSDRTPNPCINCNISLKFGAFFKRALENADGIATGHYARIEKKDGVFRLMKAKNTEKDQSYVLYGMTQDILSRTLFPLGEYTDKREIREYAQKKGLPCAYRGDSQDICFVPDGDYAGFITARCGQMPKGDFVSTDGKILGTHNGRLHYTLGQRRGLGISASSRIFVTDKRSEDNTVVVGSESDLMKSTVYCENVSFTKFDKLTSPTTFQVKIRYRKAESPAVVTPCENGVRCDFEVPQRAPSPGQAAVFYDGDEVIGGGIISSAL